MTWLSGYLFNRLVGVQLSGESFICLTELVNCLIEQKFSVDRLLR
jgi:hypothetical protein